MKNWMLSTILVASLALQSSYPISASTSGAIDINYSVIPETIEKGNNLLLNVTVTKAGKNIVENFNIDIISSGFRVLSEKEFPAKIYPNSTVHKQYVLEALDMGKHDIYSDWFYEINSTSNPNSSLITQFSDISLIGKIDVVQPSFEVEYSSLWGVTISTLIGLTAGALITRLGEKFKQRDNERKERIRNINKIKSFIGHELGNYKLRLENKQWKDEPSFWNYLIDEGLYQYLAENPSLQKELDNFRTKLLETDLNQTEEMRNGLIDQISRIEKFMEEWHVQ
jgi:hypothetical protein